MKIILAIKVFLILNIFWICACSKTKPIEKEYLISKENLKKIDLNEFIGKNITLIGRTVNIKLGAVLILENEEFIWMDGLLSWPNGYYNGNEKEAKTIKVTGVLIEKNDLPVFIQNDSIVQQGISMPNGIDLNEASHRYLLKEYKWTEIK